MGGGGARCAGAGSAFVHVNYNYTSHLFQKKNKFRVNKITFKGLNILKHVHV